MVNIINIMGLVIFVGLIATGCSSNGVTKSEATHGSAALKIARASGIYDIHDAKVDTKNMLGNFTQSGLYGVGATATGLLTSGLSGGH